MNTKRWGVILLAGVIVASVALALCSQSGHRIEGVYYAHPPELKMSADFRSNGTVLLIADDSGEWCVWRIENGRVVATGSTGSLKGKTLTFRIEGDSLFLGNMRFIKRD